jgi:LytS/YehU family sensor histidine kinase
MRWSVIAFAMAGTFYLWRYSADADERLRDESLRRASIEQQLTNTRLFALKSQIEPHFLFNTLATLRRLHHVEPAAGTHMLANFIDYLHRIMPMLERSEVPLGEELDLMQAYLSVIRIRMAGRLTVKIDVPDALRSVYVPPLALATLVENAVKHGIAPSPSAGEISISGVELAGQVELCVADTGVGLRVESGGGSGIGLSNVRARLITLYGVSSSLCVEANAPRGVRATICLPGRRSA